MRDAGELDNRGSHFYLALYWAEALAAQTEDAKLQARFKPLAATLRSNEEAIVNELNSVQGVKVDIGGYYKPDPALCREYMRPSVLLNKTLADF